MTIQNESKPSFGKRFLRGVGWFLKFLLRLIVVVIIGAGLGFAVYYAAVFGVNWFNTRLLEPIRDNTQRVSNLEAYRDNDLANLDNRLNFLQKQVDDLIIRGDTQRENLDSLSRRVDMAEVNVETALSQVESAQTELDSIAKETGVLSPRLEALAEKLAGVEKASETLQTVMSGLETDLADLTAQVEDDSPLTVLRYDIMMLKAMESLTRARLFLSQDNIGLASEEIIAARDRLLILQGMVPDDQKEAVQAMLERLTLARANLTSRPTVALEDLEVAWQLLMLGLPVTGSTVTGTVTISPTLEISPTGVLTPTTVITP